MARRATIIKDVKKSRANVLVLDAGDYYPSGGVGGPGRTASFLSRVYGALGQTIIGVGEYDLNFGVEQLKNDAHENGLRLVNANIVSKQTGKRVFDPYLIETAGWAKVGIVSVIGDDIRLNPPGEEKDAYEVSPPADAVRETLEELRGKVDVIVLLAHMNRISAQKVAEAAPGVDVMIMGHTPGPFTTKTPLMFGGVPAYQVANQGRYVGQLDLTVHRGGGITPDDLIIHSLDDNVPYDDEILKMVEEFREGEAAISKEELASRQIERAGKAGAPEEYLGTGMCARCHLDAYRAYTESAHSNAYYTLVEREKSQDKECVSCHVTGFGEEGGYVASLPRTLTTDLTSVQCEACHDRGTLHSRDGKYLAKAKESCVRCHTKEYSPGFDYAKYWKRIKH